MGFNYRSLNKLIKEDRHYFQNKKIIALGVLYPFLSKKEEHLIMDLGINKKTNKEDFAKYLFQNVLKAEVYHTLDVDEYQGAQIIANLNLDLDEKYKNQYDVVFDAGTLEHLSNIPKAFQNIFDLLKDDGIFYFGSPCNNWIDHGFFQFSPTFFKDLNRYNKCIFLEKLSIEIPFISETYNLLQKPGLKSLAIYNNKYKSGIQGIIRKVESKSLNFNFIQEKYDILFVNSLKDKQRFSGNKNILKTYLKRLFLDIIRNHSVPLKLRLKMIDLLYFAKRSFS